MKFNYYNPVKIVFGNGRIEELPQLIGSRKALFLTSPSFEKNGTVKRILEKNPQIKKVIAQVQPNPDFDYLRNTHLEILKEGTFEVIVALGGGSVIDSAKVFSVLSESNSFEFVEKLIRGTLPKNNYKLIPIIAVPTTAGTGSEVTPWATVWDNAEKKKYSLHLPDLWPQSALLDPELSLSLPLGITISTALDALSHALESLWNKNRNPVTSLFAVEAAKEILWTLPRLKEDPANLELRGKMLLASTHAGFAFSNTSTSIAHAISYYLTSHFGVSHGLACGFSLPDILDAAWGVDEELDSLLDQIFGKKSSQPLRSFFNQLGVSTLFKDYGATKEVLAEIQKSLKGIPQAATSLINVDKLFKKWID